MTSVADSVATDSELLRAHLAGDATAFEQLHQRHHDLVWRTCRRLVPAAEVEDAVQAVFLVLLRQAPRVQHHACLPAWLVTTADLTCRTAERDRRRRQRGQEPLPVAELTAPPETTAGDAQLDAVFSAVTAALSDLNARQQAVVVRHLMQGEPQATIAEEFGVAVGTIASDLNRALARLRRLLARRGITVSALGLGLACRAEADVPVPPISITSPSPQVLALANQVASIMQKRRLRHHLVWAFALLGLLASGGMAVDLARDSGPAVTPPAPVANLPATTVAAFRLPDMARSRERFARSPYASQGWVWPASTQQIRQALEQTRGVELGLCVREEEEGAVLHIEALDAVAAASSWEAFFKPNPIFPTTAQTAPLRWEAWHPLSRSRPAPPTADAPAVPKKTQVSVTLGREFPPVAQAAAPGLNGPFDPEVDFELVIRLEQAFILTVYAGAKPPLDASNEDHDRPGQPRFAAIDWQFTPSGVRETFRRIPGAAEAARLAGDPGVSIGNAIFAPLGSDTLAAIAVADPGATLIAPWLSGSRAWCDERLTGWGLPLLNDLIAQLNGTAVLSVRMATPFPVLDLDLTCTREFGETVLGALTRQGATTESSTEATASGARTLVVGPLAIRVTWVDGHLRATSDPQGFRSPPADAGAFLRDPEIVAARARSGEASARILGLSRSGAFWSTAARLLSGMGLPLAREMPQRIAAHTGGGYLRYTTTPAAIAYDAEGLAGGPLGLLGVIGLIQSDGQVLDPAILLHSLAATLSRPEF